MGETKHDRVARELAEKKGVAYNRGAGADIQGSRQVIEVETPDTIGDAGRQLQVVQEPRVRGFVERIRSREDIVGEVV